MKKIINNFISKIKTPKAKSQKLKAISGFTLIETLIAITVLILSVSAPLEIAAHALFSAFYARDQITAYYLAAEAIEYVKNGRDTTFLNDVFNNKPNTDWLSGFSACIPSLNNTDFKGCYVETTRDFYGENGLSVVPCDPSTGPENTCPALKFDTTTGLWGYTLGLPSKFKRKVVITPQDNIGGTTEEALITVTIEWKGQSLIGGNHSYTLTGSMLNWERK